MVLALGAGVEHIVSQLTLHKSKELENSKHSYSVFKSQQH